ncbi:MAG TPA: HIT family protein [Candidatus Paceibacterota bacterium]|nr:HIT family protein [Candidatus Paceibacterota bacterium]
MEDTVFMKIIRREIPADIVYEDADTLAFLDIHPTSTGHTLVVPKKPFRNIFDIDDATLAAVGRTTHRVAKAIKEAVGAEGLNIITNNEAAAGQIVFHYHVHIVPRFTGDGLRSWTGKPYSDAATATAVAEKIRQALG